MKKISIIIPMKNAAPYIFYTIDSILSQKWQNIEIIVVNDKSTDKSKEIVENISDKRIHIIEGPGKGVSAAWNAGFNASTGEIIMTSDADDIIPFESISLRANFLIKNEEYGAVCGGLSSMNTKGKHIANLWNIDDNEHEITSELQSGITRTSLCTFAISREFILQLGGKREFFESAEDIDLQLRLADVCRVWYIPVEMYCWRLHEYSLTHTQVSPRRIFFENYARELCFQRSAKGKDELDLGSPRLPPIEQGKPISAKLQICGMRIGEIWHLYNSGRKKDSRQLAFITVIQNLTNIDAWKTLIILNVKIFLKKEKVKV